MKFIKVLFGIESSLSRSDVQIVDHGFGNRLCLLFSLWLVIVLVVFSSWRPASSEVRVVTSSSSE